MQIDPSYSSTGALWPADNNGAAVRALYFQRMLRTEN